MEDPLKFTAHNVKDYGYIIDFSVWESKIGRWSFAVDCNILAFCERIYKYVSYPSTQHHFYSSFILLTGALSTPWMPSGETHFLILELPEPQRVTGPGWPTRPQQAQPPSCLQEVYSESFVFSLYKRKFYWGLPGRNDEANTHTHTTVFHSLRQTKNTKTHIRKI